ncbi:GrpE protein [Gloeothece citriformis PCC 7424]|uniref:Protein GrpE n=1 Tax=Gloeothece citriformis (strain PCC 7424) TaxID=65393 RepID=GRPE_GLOC7|nr:nucleotide exchange factor GrpE [Gloeothece citriformis]B7KLH9.1 RecName: Full=Protein GrpE; AltName: Full=HSP-70 cofactor [Gloeothece citriformis PCC 7424]ACK72551.1 GrpE protein [Gloeothece citriformis PCC 7424]
MSEDNRPLEEQLGNRAESPNTPESVREDNSKSQNNHLNQPSSTPQTPETTADNTFVESELLQDSQGIEKLLATLAEQIGSTQEGQEILGQLQPLLTNLIQQNESLLQTNQSLKDQLEEQNQQIDAAKRRYIGLAAEFDNFRKRTLREKEELEKQAKRKTLSELLTVVDNFERARLQIKPSNEGEGEIHKSYQGVYKNLVDSLKRLGVSAMRAEGEPFDPMYHEAMLREPTNDFPEGTVIEQLVRGYLLDDQVLRHAMVKVAAPKEPDSSETESTSESVSDVQQPTT